MVMFVHKYLSHEKRVPNETQTFQMTGRHTVSEIYGWPDVWNPNHTLDMNHLRPKKTTCNTPTVSGHGIKKLENCYKYSSIPLDKLGQDTLFLKFTCQKGK